METEKKKKKKKEVFPWAKIGKNDHSNPHIESTTVLSDNYKLRELWFVDFIM